jgi:hypothetical protein
MSARFFSAAMGQVSILTSGMVDLLGSSARQA